jgi:hypothetical protein
MRGLNGQVYCPHNSALEEGQGKSDITVHYDETQKTVYSTKDNGLMFTVQDGGNSYSSSSKRNSFNSTIKSSSNEKRNLIIR